jgi:hypothetical protein
MFDKQRDAVRYLHHSFKELHDLTENIAVALGGEKTPLCQSVGLEQLGELRKGEKRTLLLMIEDTTTCKGMELGVTEEGRAYAREVPPKT